MSQPQKYYTRFSVFQRIEHWVQVFAFTALAVTGLPQKFAGAPWAENMIAALGGIEAIRMYHRYAATILLIGVIYHGGALTYHIFVKRTRLSMIPGWQDVQDFYAVMAYNFGLKGARPKMPRFNFEEKIEYWAFVWGTIIMALTGFMLWNPIATVAFLPGSFIPAAKAAHGGEALLAVLAIIVWHMWGVHLRKFNKSMFTGKLSRSEMAHEHALELEQIEYGTLPPPPPQSDIARRRRIFIPVGTVIALALVSGLYGFLTMEETAISTVVAATNDEDSYRPLTTGENIHATLTQYTGPESCAAAGCHPANVLDQVANSSHSQRVAIAGPDPLLAKIVPAGSDRSNDPPDCLLCHAQDYQPDDLLASAQSVRAAGGSSCERCHTSHSSTGVHPETGLACVSCHTSTEHQIEAQADCTRCHAKMPHQDPFINSKHQRLDCRTCHVNAPVERIQVKTGTSTQHRDTGFYSPTVERKMGQAQFEWKSASGQPATVDDETAKIVPVIPVIVRAPAGFDPLDFAVTGNAAGQLQEIPVQVVPSHGIAKESARTCDTCHGPDGTFDFAALGYTQEAADQLSAKATEPVE